MRISSQLLLTFLLNALWQIALIAALAALGSWLLRNSVARYRHWLWVSALCLAFLVPAITSSRTLDRDRFYPRLRTQIRFCSAEELHAILKPKRIARQVLHCLRRFS